MQIDSLGSPVLEQPGDVQRLDILMDRICDELYGRLPRFARLFLSRDALRKLLSMVGDAIVKRAGF